MVLGVRACWQRDAILAFILVILTSSSQVFSLGAFQLMLLNFRNDKGLAADTSCCNNTGAIRQYTNISICREPCQTFFRICLSHFQANIPLEPQCTYGLITTPILGQNSFNLSNVSDDGYLASFQFNFTWTGSFSLVIEAFQGMGFGIPQEGSPRKLILRVAIQRLLSIDQNWTKETYTVSSKTLSYAYRAVCLKTYYGSGCIGVCAPRDDLFGHYDCDSDGQKVCKIGWRGSYCESAICLEGCNATFGSCISPFECRCRYGWSGRFCDECVRYPDCSQGNCILPWQCNCYSGWGGPLCNIDLNFCTHQNPCLNGGTCSNNRLSNYTCVCLPGFRGRNCDTESCVRMPCRNGGTCQETNETSTCLCLVGYSGVRCEQNASTVSWTPQAASSDTYFQTTSLDETLNHSKSTTRFYDAPVSMQTSQLTWTEIVLIVCLGGLLPVILAVIVGVVCVMLKQKRSPEQSPSKPVKSDFRGINVTSLTTPDRSFPRLNNSEEKNCVGGSEVVRNGDSQSNRPDAPPLNHKNMNQKVLNVNLRPDYWLDEPLAIWTRQNRQEFRTYKSEVQDFHSSWESPKRLDNISDKVNIDNFIRNHPRKQTMEPSHRSRPAVEYDFVSVIARWHYDYPASTLTTDV